MSSPVCQDALVSFPAEVPIVRTRPRADSKIRGRFMGLKGLRDQPVRTMGSTYNYQGSIG